MNFSKKILYLSQSPKFMADEVLDNQVSINLSHNNAKLRVSFTTIDINDEVCFDQISYQTNLSGIYLGLFDGFVALMHRRPLEAIDRFPAKELDYYLRDEPSIPSISGLDENFYEILGIGEEIKKSYFKIDKDHSPKLKQDFLTMSLSEQLEFIEEVFAYHIYSSGSEFRYLEISDIEFDECTVLIFNSSSDVEINTVKLSLFLEEILAIKCIVQVDTI